MTETDRDTLPEKADVLDKPTEAALAAAHKADSSVPEAAPEETQSQKPVASATSPSPKAEDAAHPGPPKREPEKPVAPPAPRFVGRLDDVTAGTVHGWAMDANDPARRLTVEIWSGDRFLAVGEASRFRGDLARSGHGDGYSSFAIALPRLPAGDHVVQARISGDGHVLTNSPTVTIPSTNLRGAIERVEGLSLFGWIVSSAADPLTIQILCDGAPIAAAVFPAPVPDKPCEIRAALPVSLADGRVHWLQLRARESGRIVAETAAVLPIVETSEQALQVYARDFPGYLSQNAANRQASLEGQIDALAAASPESLPLPLADSLRQLRRANAQVKRGIVEQSGSPAPFHFPVHDKPRVSVVIPVHNKFWVTYNCLAALLLAPNKTSFEVIVIDDGSSDMTLKLADFAKGVTILRNESSLGFVKSSNRGAQAARGDYVVMLNNDTEPCAHWIDELIHVFERFDKVGLAGAKLIYPDGKLQEAGGVVLPNFDVSNYGRGGNQFDTRFNYTRQVDYISGACIMLPRALWDELGGFDELFAPAYYEDNDLAFRVRAKGLKTYYTPFSKVVHFEGVSSGTSLTSGAKRFQAVNEPKFRARWASTIRALPGTLDPDLAKDRGVLLRALFIDAEVPQPDKDAGSYATQQEIRLLQALGFKVTFAPYNLTYLGGYTEALQRDGVECLYAPFSGSIEDVIERRGREFDVIYISRYSIAARYIDIIRAKAPQAKIVFNNADLHFLREIRAAIAAKNPQALQNAVQTRDAELSVMKRADVTLSYSDTEAAVILSHTLDETRVARCPWVVDVDETVPPFAARDSIAFLGNFRHPPNEEAVRHFIAEIMPALRREVPGLVFKVYGSHQSDDLRALEAEDVHFEGHVADLAEVYHACRVFVAPLVSGAGVKGKVIGALAAGVPTIMSPIASEGIGASNGAEALVAHNVDEWVAAIKAIHDDEKRWTDMSERARAFARRNFSFEQGVARMKAALAVAGFYVD